MHTLARICLTPPPSAEGLPSGSKPNKGRQPEEGVGARPGRVTAPPFPPGMERSREGKWWGWGHKAA